MEVWAFRKVLLDALMALDNIWERDITDPRFDRDDEFAEIRQPLDHFNFLFVALTATWIYNLQDA